MWSELNNNSQTLCVIEMESNNKFKFDSSFDVFDVERAHCPLNIHTNTHANSHLHDDQMKIGVI